MGFGLAPIKKQGNYIPFDVDRDDTKSYILPCRNGKLIFRNYQRELKNGKGLTLQQACDKANAIIALAQNIAGNVQIKE